MKTLRCLMLLPILFMKVWPVGMGHATEAVQAGCTMDCCTWLVEEGLAGDCACVKETGAPARQTPALPTGETGSGKAVQPAWVFADERFAPSGGGFGVEEVQVCLDSDGMEGQPHVRLTVLFNVFLI